MHLPQNGWKNNNDNIIISFSTFLSLLLLFLYVIIFSLFSFHSIIVQNTLIMFFFSICDNLLQLKFFIIIFTKLLRESVELCTREKSVGIERGCVLQTDDKHLEANTNKEGAEVCGSFVGGFFAKSSKDFEGLATSGSHNKDGMRFKEAVYMAKRTHHFILRVR